MSKISELLEEQFPLLTMALSECKHLSQLGAGIRRLVIVDSLEREPYLWPSRLLASRPCSLELFFKS